VTIIAKEHYWRTADGRIVRTGDVDADVLAYPAGDSLPDDVARELGLLDPPKKAEKPAKPAETEPDDEQDEKPDTKQDTKPANKSRAKPADK
jgi:hypothetical protein